MHIQIDAFKENLSIHIWFFYHPLKFASVNTTGNRSKYLWSTYCCKHKDTPPPPCWYLTLALPPSGSQLSHHSLMATLTAHFSGLSALIFLCQHLTHQHVPSSMWWHSVSVAFLSFSFFLPSSLPSFPGLLPLGYKHAKTRLMSALLTKPSTVREQ